MPKKQKMSECFFSHPNIYCRTKVKPAKGIRPGGFYLSVLYTILYITLFYITIYCVENKTFCYAANKKLNFFRFAHKFKQKSAYDRRFGCAAAASYRNFV